MNRELETAFTRYRQAVLASRTPGGAGVRDRMAADHLEEAIRIARTDAEWIWLDQQMLLLNSEFEEWILAARPCNEPRLYFADLDSFRAG